MSLQVTARPPTVPLPPMAQDEMTLHISCEQCGCQFAVIGAAYFCPACGHNSASGTFAQSVTIARAMMRSLPTIQASLTDRDAAAQVAKTLIEGAFGTLVTAFQRIAEAEYPKLATPITPRRNAFQNLSEGSRLWHEAGGSSYASLLDMSELTTLTRLFQQRHVLAHCEGIVDQDYLDRSGDTAYQVGQRVVIREQSVILLADLLDKLVAGMRQDLPA
jgi:hypothetical protein